MDYHQQGLNISKDCYLNCMGYDGFNISLITDPQIVYQVQETDAIPHNDDQPPIILDMSNNVKVESLPNIGSTKNCNVFPQLYTCAHCDLRFHQESHLENHYNYCMKKIPFMGGNVSSENVTYINENSEVTSNISHGLISARREVKHEGNICNVCLKIFKTKDLLTKHLDRTSSEKPVKCNLCHRMLHGPSGYLRHLKTHYGKSCEVCGECGKKFTTAKALIKHQEIHIKTEPNNEYNKVINKNIKKEKVNTCNICDKTFLTKEKLEKHVKAREGDVPIKCTMCARTLHSSGYEYHLKAHSILKYNCALCNIKFVSLNELKEHKRSFHVEQQQFICDICKKCFKYNTGLKMHLRLHTGETPYSCDMCHMKFPFSSNLKYHKKIHSQERSTFCQICNISLSNTRELSTHNRIHEGEKIYKCSCGKLFRLLNSLVIHQKNSNERCIESTQVCEKKSVSMHMSSVKPLSKKYLCDKCNRSFHTMKALEKHKRRKIHTVNKVEPVCRTCGKCFQTIGHLIKHEKVHKLLGNIHKCSVCNKCFSHIDELRMHTCDHNKPKKQLEEFPCDVCGKVFTNKVNLKKHTRSHTGHRPYACEICPETFYDRSALNDHHIVHTDARNHVCGVCGKAFKSARVLKIHSRVHQTERPYKCAQCNSSFKHLGTLISHKVTHTGVKAHQCPICWMKFAHARGLKKHHRVHGECNSTKEPMQDAALKEGAFMEFAGGDVLNNQTFQSSETHYI